MTWIFSKAMMDSFANSHCSQAAAESLAATCSDGEQFAQLNVMPTQHKFWRNDKTMEHSQLSRFGLKCVVLTESHGEAVLTSFLEAFPARTYPSQEPEQESTESEAGCGESLRGSLARYDPGTHSLKTAQLSLLEGLSESSVILPRSGTMRDGMLFQLPTLARTMIVIGSGLSQEKFPTPTVCGNYNRKGASKTSGDGLATYVKKWPTPQASDNRDRGCLSTPAIDRRIKKGKQVMLSMCVSSENGRLNPMWAEWLMGWPIGWTCLKPLEMAKFQEWQQQHSMHSPEDSE